MESHKKTAKIITEWQTKLYIDHVRGPIWYAIAIAISVLTIVLSLIFGSKMFAFVIFVLSLTYIPLTLKEVPEVTCQLTTEGIQFGQHFYPYSNIKYFWIEEFLPSFQSIHFEVKNDRISDLEVQFYHMSKDELAIILQQFIPYQKDQNPSFFNHIAHILKL